LSGYIFATKAYIDNRKKNMLNGNISLTCPYNMANFGSLTAEIGWRVWAPQQISTGFAYWQRYCSDVANRRPTKLCLMFGRVLPCYIIYTFSGTLAPLRSLAGCKIYFTSKFCVLADVNSRSRSLYAIARPSVICRLSVVCLSSVVCNARAPTQAVQIFGNISTALGTFAIP